MGTSNMTSNAANFSSNIDSGVDVRTGMYSISVSLGQFISHKSSGSSMSLLLSYDAASTSDIGFGRGWNIPLSRFNKENNVLALSSGQSFQLEWNFGTGEYDLPYRKLKDIRVLYLGETSEIKVMYKDGRSEYLDFEEGTLKRTVSPSGLGIYYEYGTLNFQQVLWRIYDDAGRELTIDWWTDDWKTTVKHSQDGVVYHEISIDKSGNGGEKRLSSISLPELNSSTSFEYSYIEGSGYDVINKVVHASGLIEEIDYLNEGHSLPTNAPLTSVPYVKRHTLYPGEGQPIQYSDYAYSDKNYLGFGSDREWVAGEDTLFKANQDYRYTTTETVNGTKAVEREYNKYHLLEMVTYYDGTQCYKEESYTYFANLDVSIESQPATYSLVKEQVTTHYYQGESRSFTKSYDYDDFGNPTLEREADGSQVSRTFYSALGEGADCPAAPSGMVSFVKTERFIPDASCYSEPARTTTMTYTSLKSQAGTHDYFVVLSSQSEDNYSRRFEYYNEPGNSLIHGRPCSETLTFGQYESRVNYGYDFATDGLKTTTTLMTYDGIESTASKTVDYFFYLPIGSIDSNGVVRVCTYDLMGRAKQATVAPNTEYAATKTIDYRVGDGINAITETDIKGNVIVTHMNNAGKVVSIQRAPNGESPLTIQACEYDEYGLMIKQTDTDWLDGVPTSITTQFTYDVNGDVQTVTHQDGRQESIDQNPISLCSTYNQVGLLSEITMYNLSGQEINKESRDSSGGLLANTGYTYDGYGNLRSVVDTAGRIVEHRYDDFDRVVETERHIDGEKVIESFFYPDFCDSGTPSQVTVNGIELGSRDFDGLLRIKSESSAGSVKSYSYTGAMGNPHRITMPNGAVADITNNLYLHAPESISVQSQSNLDSIYRYDKESGQPLYSMNKGCEQNIIRDSYGRILTEKVELNDGVTRQSSYRYSLLGKLLEAVDFFGNTTTYGYDFLGRLNSMTESAAGVKTETTIEYDEYSRPWKYTTLHRGDEAVVELSYSAAGLETKRVAKFNDSDMFSIEQQYNASLLLETRIYVDATGQTTETFAYDDLYRLTDYLCDGPNQPLDDHGHVITQQTFRHDIYGNITQAVSQFSDTTSNRTDFIYDTANPVRLVKLTNTHNDYPKAVSFLYDEAGNLLNDEQGRQYHYDNLGQVVSVDGVDNQEISRYQYDASGRVVAQTVQESLLYMFYGNGQLSNELSKGVNSCYHRAAPGLTGRTVSSGENKQHQLLFGNAQGSIVETLSVSNDETERNKETRRYTPYGEG